MAPPTAFHVMTGPEPPAAGSAIATPAGVASVAPAGRATAARTRPVPSDTSVDVVAPVSRHTSWL